MELERVNKQANLTYSLIYVYVTSVIIVNHLIYKQETGKKKMQGLELFKNQKGGIILSKILPAKFL